MVLIGVLPSGVAVWPSTSKGTIWSLHGHLGGILLIYKLDFITPFKTLKELLVAFGNISKCITLAHKATHKLPLRISQPPFPTMLSQHLCYFVKFLHKLLLRGLHVFHAAFSSVFLDVSIVCLCCFYQETIQTSSNREYLWPIILEEAHHAS